ncbi:MAG: GTPase HflX [Candidatus Nanopelagicales bacterium]
MSESNLGQDGDVSLELEQRQGLRRVSSLSTELQDVTEVEYRQIRLERVVLAGVWTTGTVAQAERSLRELAQLAQTAGSEVVEGVIQRRDAPDPATYLGSGKVRELALIVADTGADTVICDGELSPGQLRKLEGIVKVKVVDRTWLILDIFAQHARSREGKAQVSLAQMQYLLPRLRGWGESLSRQAGGHAGGASGGLGTRGPGETKIETDRRRIRAQMTKLRRELKALEATRRTQRAAREASGIATVALAGYTNAGKSSVLNALTGAGVLVQDALFATLDPTVRKLRAPGGKELTIADTVGFVRHLPHDLVEAFRSTLTEVQEATLIVHVVDGCDEDPFGQVSAVREVLNEIGAGEIPELIAINKSDIADPMDIVAFQGSFPGSIVVSAHTGAGLEELLARIDAELPRTLVAIEVTIPYGRGDLISQIHESGEQVKIVYIDTGSDVSALVPAALAADIERQGFLRVG